MTESITIPLDIEGIQVKHVDVTAQNEIHIHVVSTVEGTVCHRCGREIKEIYDYGREIQLRHLPILDRPTYIFIRPRRYVCRDCAGKPTTTQRLPWYDPRSSATRAYADHVLKQLVNSTVYDVSQKEMLGYDAVEDIVDREIGQGVDWREFHELPTLGIDEVSIKKGHRDFATIVTVRGKAGENRVIGVLENREKATVKAFLSSIPKHLRDSVREVCSDMYEGYTEAAREVFGAGVTVTADRFHVAKLYRSAVDGERKKEMRRLKKELPKEEYEKFKGAMWLVRKRPGELDGQEKECLRNLFAHSPALLMTYLYSCALTGIFDRPLSKAEAEEHLRAWMRLAREQEVAGFEKFLNTLDEKMDMVTNYFVGRNTSGFVEGINHKIRVIMGRCYGLFSRVHIFQRLTLDLCGYERFA
jgi:transposase